MSRNCPYCNGLHFSLSIITCSFSREIRELHQKIFLWKFQRENLLSCSESGSRNWKYLILMEMILRDVIWRNLFILLGQPRGNRSLWEIAPSNVRLKCQRAGFSIQMQASCCNIFRYSMEAGEKKKENSLENIKSGLFLLTTHHYMVHLSMIILYIV